MKKVLIMLLVIGLASSGIGLGTAFGTPVLTGIKIGTTGTNPGFGVDVSLDGNTYTVRGTGDDIWNANDAFQYAYMQISGDFDISCCVQSFTTSNTADGWSKAGIMVRQNINTDGASPYALIAATAHGNTQQANNGISWQCRRPADPPTDPQTYILGNQSGASYYQPVYLRMTRVGNIFNGYYSQDGVEWTWMAGNAELAGNLSMALADPLYIGLAVCPHAAAELAIAQFDTIQFNYGAASPVPARGELNVDYPGPAQLSWGAIAYPEAGGYIKDWKVYFGNAPNDPNVVLIGTVTEPTRQITSPALEAGKTYYWRVDATNTVNSNVARGFWWSFTTKSARPIITKQPVDAMAAANCPATLTVEAKSGDYADQGDMTFVWKKADGTTLKTEAGVATADPEIFSSSYTQPIPAKNDPNTYWVEVSNKNGMTKSAEVNLRIFAGTPNFQATHLDNGNGIAAGTGMSRSGKTYTVIGSGNDIWDTADSFEYAYVPVSGDVTLTARVVSLTGNSGDGGWSKAGVMLRNTLEPGSMHASMDITSRNPASGTTDTSKRTFQYRTTTGGGSGDSTAAGTDPFSTMWVRIVRSGNSFSGYYSTDGITWTQQGSAQTISMANNYYMGLCVTAHSAANISVGVFDNITTTYNTQSWQPTDPVYSPLTTEGWVDPTKDLTVSWTKSDAAPCGSYYKIYAGGSPTTMTLFGPTQPDVTQIVVPAGTVPFNSTIYWRADTVLGTTTVTGTVWSFDTVKQVPLIRTQPALITVVNGGATANLNVMASSATSPEYIELTKYEWFHVVAGGDVKVLANGVPVKKWTDPADSTYGQYDCPLALANAQLADEGEYYCVVTNKIGDATSDKGRVVTHRLMLHYTFESVTGNTIPDQSASHYDATLVSAAGAGAQGKYSLVDDGLGLGKAIQLYGTTDPNGAYINTGKLPMELGVSGNLPKSVSIWAKTTVFNNAGLFDMGGYDAAGQDFSVRTLEGYNNRWRVQYWGADRDFEPTPTSFNSWTHFVLVFDGARSQLYVNGQRARDINGNLLDWASALDTQNGNTLQLGRYQQNNLFRYQGLMDDFRLYNFALTAQEAAQLYIAVKGGSVCAVPMVGDLDGNCKVDLNDFALFSAQWLTDTLFRP